MNTKTIIVLSTLFALVLSACAPLASSTRSIVATVDVEREMLAATEAPAVELDEIGIAATPASDYSGDASLTVHSRTNAMIIKEAQMDLLVDNTDRVIERITTMVAD